MTRGKKDRAAEALKQVGALHFGFQKSESVETSGPQTLHRKQIHCEL